MICIRPDSVQAAGACGGPLQLMSGSTVVSAVACHRQQLPQKLCTHKRAGEMCSLRLCLAFPFSIHRPAASVLQECGKQPDKYHRQRASVREAAEAAPHCCAHPALSSCSCAAPHLACITAWDSSPNPVAVLPSPPATGALGMGMGAGMDSGGLLGLCEGAKRLLKSAWCSSACGVVHTAFCAAADKAATS